MSIDRERLVALLEALDASPRCLERPVCRGWVGDWQITGKHGHATTDGTGYLLYAHATPRRWTSIKQSLSFCKLSQDGDDEGILCLDRLPNEAEAKALRDALGVRKHRHMTEAQIERSRSVLASARSLINRGSYALGSIEPPRPLPSHDAVISTLMRAIPARFCGFEYPFLDT
jgi:hypothetical protein